MEYPKFRAAQATVGIKKPRLVPGTYLSTITSIEEAPGFAANSAMKISYLLEKGGTTFEFSEVMMISASYKRTADFMKYLIDNGYDPEYLGDLIGVRERIDLLKEDKGPGRGVHLNIVNREFIKDGGDGADGDS